MLWLYDRSLAVVATVHEFDSITTVRKWSDHSTISARLSADETASIAASHFCIVEGDPTVYLVERFAIDQSSGAESVTFEGRGATAMLHRRTLEGQFIWNATPGAIVESIIGSFTTTRALAGLAFGTGNTVGTASRWQRSWGDAGNIAWDIVKAQALSMQTRLDGTTVKIDVVAPTSSDMLLGQAHGTAAKSQYSIREDSWRNYAIVLGAGEGAARVRVDVDWTSGNELRELYVDAKDLQDEDEDGVAILAAQYEQMLAARGAEKLAETRRVEVVGASPVPLIEPGTVAWYDSGRWSASLMVTEAQTIREKGTVKHAVSMGEPIPTLKQTIRRYF